MCSILEDMSWFDVFIVFLVVGVFLVVDDCSEVMILSSWLVLVNCLNVLFVFGNYKEFEVFLLLFGVLMGSFGKIIWVLGDMGVKELVRWVYLSCMIFVFGLNVWLNWYCI